MKPAELHRQYIADNVGIDPSKLTDKDAEKLAKFINSTVELETPRIAEFHRKRLIAQDSDPEFFRLDAKGRELKD